MHRDLDRGNPGAEIIIIIIIIFFFFYNIRALAKGKQLCAEIVSLKFYYLPNFKQADSFCFLTHCEVACVSVVLNT